jgi:hypothetical protein
MQVHKPSSRINLIVSLLVGALLLAVAPLGLLAQSQAEQYFPDTGHTVRGEFFDYFNAHGGLRVFGFPITEEFTLNGRTVQYFQRVRMELWAGNTPGPRGELGGAGADGVVAGQAGRSTGAVGGAG